MAADFQILYDHQERAIRLTSERWSHIVEHPEMAGQRERVAETLAAPERGVATIKDGTVHTYHRHYDQTPVTRKYLVVAVKIDGDDAFVLTAFFSGQVKRGTVIWQK